MSLLREIRERLKVSADNMADSIGMGRDQYRSAEAMAVSPTVVVAAVKYMALREAYRRGHAPLACEDTRQMVAAVALRLDPDGKEPADRMSTLAVKFVGPLLAVSADEKQVLITFEGADGPPVTLALPPYALPGLVQKVRELGEGQPGG